MQELGLITRARAHGRRVAIVSAGRAFTYEDLLARSDAIARSLLARGWAPKAGQGPSRIAYLLPAGFDHVATQWAIWRAGAIGVPLSTVQAPAEWAYAVADTQASVVVVDPALEGEMAAARGRAATPIARVETLSDAADVSRPCVCDARGALILYTSGTTGTPKGVVLTHANLGAQVRGLVEAWAWQASDRILHVLPLHHVHGIVNVLTCALWAGATCEMLPRFDAEAVWQAFTRRRLTLFMAVPTIYAKLVAAWDAASPESRDAMREGCAAMRLMVSGSAALPVTVREKWRAISGHVLLERYGMTEIGMALSNPLHGERRPGFVGVPLPGVQVRVVDEHGETVQAGTAGELEVRGDGVFREYWQRQEATAMAFRDTWFRTGDVAVLEGGMYRLLGRLSVDIIKSGGYKISALEIEEVLREHPQVRECAVVGLEDEAWGERIAVAVTMVGDAPLELEPLREWAKSRLARYKLPTRLVSVPELPRNAMGKVSKQAVKGLFDRLPRVSAPQRGCRAGDPA
jgi:malonyl-CoA/methylmalonyl-CoA synthetase